MAGIRIKNVAAGFIDGKGVFHPIRSSKDYDPDIADEAFADKTYGTGLKYPASKAPSRKRTGKQRRSPTYQKRASAQARYAASKRKKAKRNPYLPTPGVTTQYDTDQEFDDTMRGIIARGTRVASMVYKILYTTGGKYYRGDLDTNTIYVTRKKPATAKNPAVAKVSNPLTTKWTPAKVRKTSSGDVQVMIPLKKAIKRATVSIKRTLKKVRGKRNPLPSDPVYTLSSSMGGYLGSANTIGRARQTAQKLANDQGYTVYIKNRKSGVRHKVVPKRRKR